MSETSNVPEGFQPVQSEPVFQPAIPQSESLKQPTKHPTDKVGASGFAGQVVAAAVAIATAYGLDIPPVVVAEITALVSLWAGYQMRERQR